MATGTTFAMRCFRIMELTTRPRAAPATADGSCGSSSAAAAVLLGATCADRDGRANQLRFTGAHLSHWLPSCEGPVQPADHSTVPSEL